MISLSLTGTEQGLNKDILRLQMWNPTSDPQTAIDQGYSSSTRELLRSITMAAHTVTRKTYMRIGLPIFNLAGPMDGRQRLRIRTCSEPRLRFGATLRPG